MSTDAGLDLLAAVRTALVADTFVQGLVAGRVFSSWGNQDVATPLIRMSLGRAERFEMDFAGDGSDTSISVHVFTAEDAPVQCRQIASRVRDVLQDAPLALSGSNLFQLQFRDILQIPDPQSPALQMAVVRFNAFTTTK